MATQLTVCCVYAYHAGHTTTQKNTQQQQHHVYLVSPLQSLRHQGTAAVCHTAPQLHPRPSTLNARRHRHRHARCPARHRVLRHCAAAQDHDQARPEHHLACLCRKTLTACCMKMSTKTYQVGAAAPLRRLSAMHRAAQAAPHCTEDTSPHAKKHNVLPQMAEQKEVNTLNTQHTHTHTQGSTALTPHTQHHASYTHITSTTSPTWLPPTPLLPGVQGSAPTRVQCHGHPNHPLWLPLIQHKLIKDPPQHVAQRAQHGACISTVGEQREHEG